MLSLNLSRALLLTLCLATTLSFAITIDARAIDDAKMLLHVQPYVTKNRCTTNAPTEIGCNASSDPVQTTGDLNTPYIVYLIAANLDPAVGFKSIALGVFYDDEEKSGVDILGWDFCGDLELPDGNWPFSAGSGTEMTWLPKNCQGTAADPSDNDGRSFSVLGNFYVYAYGQDQLWVTRRFARDQAFAITPCGDFQQQPIDLDPISNAGMAAFGGGEGYNPCKGVLDRFPTPCCLETGCESQDPLYCQFLGGVPQPLGTTLKECLANCVVATERSSWGRIKQKYN